ncbi:MAG: alpha/beta hydrolase, partial [Verrucomicrobiota bacterium]
MIAAARGQLRRPDGGALGFARYGDPSGRPLLYFHGWPGSARQGALADEAAKTLGWQLVALDR